MRTTKLMAGALTLLVLVGGAAAAETVQSSEGTVYTLSLIHISEPTRH